jgi:hypothetical protein
MKQSRYENYRPVGWLALPGILVVFLLLYLKYLSTAWRLEEKNIALNRIHKVLRGIAAILYIGIPLIILSYWR